MLRISERRVTGDDGATVVVVTPHGDLDMASLAGLHAALGRTIRTAQSAGDRARVVLDLAAVDVLHPVALGVLLDARRRCLASGRRFCLAAVSDEVAAVLAEADVLPPFDIVGSATAADEQ